MIADRLDRAADGPAQHDRRGRGGVAGGEVSGRRRGGADRDTIRAGGCVLECADVQEIGSRRRRSIADQRIIGRSAVVVADQRGTARVAQRDESVERPGAAAIACREGIALAGGQGEAKPVVVAAYLDSVDEGGTHLNVDGRA